MNNCVSNRSPRLDIAALGSKLDVSLRMESDRGEHFPAVIRRQKENVISFYWILREKKSSRSLSDRIE